MVPSPGLPLCAEASPRTRSAAILADSRDNIPPRRWLRARTFATLHRVAFLGAYPGSLATAAGLPLSRKAPLPGLWNFVLPSKSSQQAPEPCSLEGGWDNLSDHVQSTTTPQFPSPPDRAETPGSRGALTDPDDVGHPARVWDPEGAHEEPGPVFPNQTPEAPPGSGHRWAPPSVPGARPWRAPWGGSSRRGRAAAPEAPPGPAARLPSASASGGRPAALRTSYWGAAPPAPAPPRLPPTGGPRVKAPGLRPGSARTRLRRLRLASARLPRGLPTCPGCRAGLHASPAAPPPAAADAIARARTKPRSGVARAHTLPPSPLPRALPPASRAARRPPPALPPRTPPRTHASHSHSPGCTLARSHLRRGRGRGPWTGFGRGDARRMETILRSSDVPICPAAPRARHGAWEPSVEPRSWQRELGDGGNPVARPAGRDAPAGSRETRSLPSAEPRLSAPTRPTLAGRRQQETWPGAVFHY